ncbi:hypothetical protein GCM10027047_23930 [Rhodococcus aerolatus]
MGWLGTWWDSVELWLVGLPFVLQVPVVLGVVVPLCGAVAVGLDRGADVVAARLPTLGAVSTRRRSVPDALRARLASPRFRITATLVGLLVLVVLASLLRAV